MKQIDFIEQVYFSSQDWIKPIEISNMYDIPPPSTRRNIRILFKEGKLEQMILKPNSSKYRWKNESI